MDVVFHCEPTSAVSVPLGIIPVEVNTSKKIAIPVFTHFIVLIEDSEEVVSMLPADIFHTKIIND